jgi:hypothetical protein
MSSSYTTSGTYGDVSDIRPDSGGTAGVNPNTLPIRGEKRIIPSNVDPDQLNSTFEKIDLYKGPNGQMLPPDKLPGYGTKGGAGRTKLVQQGDFKTVLAMKPYVDYVIVRIPHRGLGTNGMPDTDAFAVYRFLINPSQVQIQRTTLDAQAMSRAGWQIGVWGEDSVTISLTGKTAGQYWSFGITDRYQPFTESYRNLLQLQMVHENNGYWFEGEQLGEGPLAADFTRRRIKMHEDVQLIVGNFMWYGMFESLNISQEAETPWYAEFQMTFIAWKERFRSGSPYNDTIHNDIQRGHSYSAFASAATATQRNQVPVATSSVPDTILPPTQTPPSPMPPTPTAPAVAAAQADQTLPTQNDTCALDSSPTIPLLYQNSSSQVNFWNGIR